MSWDGSMPSCWPGRVGKGWVSLSLPAIFSIWFKPLPPGIGLVGAEPRSTTAVAARVRLPLPRSGVNRNTFQAKNPGAGGGHRSVVRSDDGFADPRESNVSFLAAWGGQSHGGERTDRSQAPRVLVPLPPLRVEAGGPPFPLQDSAASSRRLLLQAAFALVFPNR